MCTFGIVIIGGKICGMIAGLLLSSGILGNTRGTPPGIFDGGRGRGRGRGRGGGGVILDTLLARLKGDPIREDNRLPADGTLAGGNGKFGVSGFLKGVPVKLKGDGGLEGECRLPDPG